MMVSSPSSSIVSCWPSRELFREYGRGGPGVRGFCACGALGAGLAKRGGAGLAKRGGAPITLLEKPCGVVRPLLTGDWRCGDSGLRIEGRGRGPGPTD